MYLLQVFQSSRSAYLEQLLELEDFTRFDRLLLNVIFVVCLNMKCTRSKGSLNIDAKCFPKYNEASSSQVLTLIII